MNKTWLQFNFNITDERVKELLIAALSDIGFDGFEEQENSLSAFIESSRFDEHDFNAIIAQHKLTFSQQQLPEQNWNHLWEQNFEPVVIDGNVAIRAHFHQPITNVQHEIVITPKMSFGTGHHATTHMMLREMGGIHFTGSTVLDYGTGTGVLAIYAAMLGATAVTAIDNDEWSISNAAENIRFNHCNSIELFAGDKPLEGKVYNVVLANINKNIITDNFTHIHAALAGNATLLLSGLLATDEADIVQLATGFNLQHISTCHRDKWICMKFLGT